MNKILPLKVERSERAITPSSGLLLTYESMLGLGLDQTITQKLPKPGSNRGYCPTNYVVPLILMQHAGGNQLEDLPKLAQDQTITDILKAGKKNDKKEIIPSSDAAGDWLRRMGGPKTSTGRAQGAGLIGLGYVQSQLCNRILDEMGIRDVTLDADATIIAGNKEEAEWSYKKIKGFQPLLGYVAELGLCLHDQFRAGNIAAQDGAVEFIEECRQQLSRGRKIKAVRSDSAWYQASVLNWCEDNNAVFAIAADKDEAVLAAVKEIAEESWKPLVDKKGVQTGREIAETVHSMEKTKRAFRLIVQRWEIKREETLFGTIIKYGYRVIASNRKDSATKVVYWYNQRGQCENWIKEEKLGFGTEYLPCGQLGANAVFFRIGLLAYNLSVAMKYLVFPQTYKNKQIRTIRWQVYQWAGYLVKHAGRKTLRICASGEFIKFFNFCRHRCWLLSTA